MKKLYTESNIQDIADAIREKNGTNDTYKTSEMAAAIEELSGERTVVNGIIEQYKAATGTVSADTFVEFVNGSLADGMEVGADTQLSSASDSYYNASAVALDSSRVFVAYRNTYIYGVVCIIDGTTITVGTNTQLSSVSYAFHMISAIRLGTNKVFIAHKSGSNNLYGVVCTISGTTITVGTDTLFTGVSISRAPWLALIDADTVLITYPSDDRNRKPYGVVCTISGTTITVGTATLLADMGTTSIYAVPAVILDLTHVFVVLDASNTVYCTVCQLSGTTITAGSPTQIASHNYTSTPASSAALIDTDKVFVVYQGGSYYSLYGIVCTVSDTAIVTGANMLLKSGSYALEFSSIVKVSTNRVFIAYGGKTTEFLYGMVCDVNGTTISIDTEMQLSSVSGSYSSVCATLFDDNKVFVIHRNSDYLYGVVVTGSRTVQPSATKTEGLTKTDCTVSTAGDVWVLNTNESD